MERWLPIAGFEGAYEVSDEGRVRSLPRQVVVLRGRQAGSLRTVRGGFLRLTPVSGGYLAACLCRDGEQLTRTVHQLVLEAFVGPCPEGMEACHGNGDRTDARFANLRWDTKVGNMADKVLHGTHQQGSQHGNAVLTESDVASLREAVAAGERVVDVAARFGISEGAARKMVSGQSWGHLPVLGRGRHGNAHLTAEQVAQIRGALAAGARQADVARRFGVSDSTVRRLRLGEAWRGHDEVAAGVDVDRRAHHRAKLTDEQVREVRRRVAAGELVRAVARDVGVTESTAAKVARGESYQHVK